MIRTSLEELKGRNQNRPFSHQPFNDFVNDRIVNHYPVIYRIEGVGLNLICDNGGAVVWSDYQGIDQAPCFVWSSGGIFFVAFPNEDAALVFKLML